MFDQFSQFSELFTICVIGGQCLAFIWYIVRRVITFRIMEKCVRDVARTHLPFIYARLNLICDNLHIPHGEHPPIQFVDLNNHKR